MADGMRDIRIFVSSPGDARFERSRLDRVVERLNGIPGHCRGCPPSADDAGTATKGAAANLSGNVLSNDIDPDDQDTIAMDAVRAAIVAEQRSK